MILALAGGVGGAKLANGLTTLLDVDDLLVVVNTGDDFEHFGLPISPDLDTVLYTLAGVNNPDTGWGLLGETWEFMNTVERLGEDTWFRLGDRDLATHVLRARGFGSGHSLSRITTDLAQQYGVNHPIVPMSDQKVRTIVETDMGSLPFQIYFVREKCEPLAKAVTYEGASEAQPSEAFSVALDNRDISAIIICPSNPLLSIAPILALPNVKVRLQAHMAPVVAVSPIIGGRAIKGPAAKMFSEMKLESSALGVAIYYRDILDGIVIDLQDSRLVSAISSMGIRVKTTNIVMESTSDQTRLADEVLEFARLISDANECKAGDL
tara:strand:- start:21 stop:989 length:969 start_codon:yes stop_codon:yes gene_type:complete